MTRNSTFIPGAGRDSHVRAACHPGGGVTGVPGHNAAREILSDLGRNFPANILR